MSSILGQTHCVLRFPNQPKSRSSIFSPKGNDVLLTVSCIGFDGSWRNRQTRRGAASSGRETGEDGEDENVRARPDSQSQEDLMALFRRIQSSIAEEERVDNAKVSDEKSSAYSILKALGESERKKKGVVNSKVFDEKSSPFSILKAFDGARNEETKRIVRDNVNSKSTLRPPSNFVRRSPIPSPTIPREVSQTSAELGGERLIEMKLSQLKVLAKSRGFKGYSKLKKSELINLLKSF